MSGLDQLTLFVISLVANLFSAFSGGGAGLIQLPVLIFLGLPFALALATHKVASVALGIGATIRHLREGRLERHLVLTILAWGLPGVVLGANVILGVPERMAEIALGFLTARPGADAKACAPRPAWQLDRRTGAVCHRGIKRFAHVWNRPVCNPLAGALVRAGLPSGHCLYPDPGWRFLE